MRGDPRQADPALHVDRCLPQAGIEHPRESADVPAWRRRSVTSVRDATGSLRTRGSARSKRPALRRPRPPFPLRRGEVACPGGAVPSVVLVVFDDADNVDFNKMHGTPRD